MADHKNLDQRCINAIRMLAVDQVEKAKSGHPGMPLGAAPMAYVVWTKMMRHNPYNPSWVNRDRFVLSAGHGSALLYAVLHLTGYDLMLDELKNFRQYESRTPGHPEYWCAPGVESTTGPLGQGFAMGVGMALAERFMRGRYTRDGKSPMDHYTYAIVSDGDLMEGVASEAASIAGHLKLGKLIYLYDDNHISIEGDTELAFTEGVPERFDAYGWHVQRIEDGNDTDAIEKAVSTAQETTDKPSIICVRTNIGFGSPKQDSASSHGEPLGADAIAKTKEYFGWPADEPFHVPEDVRDHFKAAVERGQRFEEEWKRIAAEYCEIHPEDYARFEREMAGELILGWDEKVPSFEPGKALATRSSSGAVINALAEKLPNLIGGSADLGPSNKTEIKGGGSVGPEMSDARNLHFGVREHAMGAIVNGMALHGGTIPYGGTFLIFSDYMRPSIRLAALMDVHSTFVFTHDSVGLGEDGPTHQPIEQLMSLRAIPNLTVFRPADANETAVGWRLAVERKKPIAFALSRQNLPVIDATKHPINDAARGGYVISDCKDTPDVILIATGSEVALALEAQSKLSLNVRVVSMPSWEIFAEQDQSYREKVLPPAVTKRVAIEAGVTLGWERWVGSEGKIIGIDRFGLSAPGDVAMNKLGINLDNVLNTVRSLLSS